jgi:hypothetical protein
MAVLFVFANDVRTSIETIEEVVDFSDWENQVGNLELLKLPEISRR